MAKKVLKPRLPRPLHVTGSGEFSPLPPKSPSFQIVQIVNYLPFSMIFSQHRLSITLVPNWSVINSGAIGYTAQKHKAHRTSIGPRMFSDLRSIKIVFHSVHQKKSWNSSSRKERGSCFTTEIIVLPMHPLKDTWYYTTQIT